MRTRADLVHALRWLRRDFGVTVEALAERLFVNPPGIPPADSDPLDNGRMWAPATRDRVMEIAGLWSPADFDSAVPPIVVARVGDPCWNCAVAGAPLDPLDASKLDPYEAGVMTACECCELPPCPNCADNNACTIDYCNRVCEAVWCVNQWINCNDGNSCTIDGCNPQSGCYHTPKDCDDGDVCTRDLCLEGTCDHTPLCGAETCCPVDDWLFCCDEGEDQCCPSNPAWANHCCKPDETCCGAGCCPAGKHLTCCNELCGYKGACCFFDTGSCTETTGECCLQQGGTHQGTWTACNPPDLCRPKCENCRMVSATFYECSHESETDACSTTECIENTINTATCDRFLYRLGASNCNAKTLDTVPYLVQRIRQLEDSSCANYWPGGYHEVLPIFHYGCGLECWTWPGPLRTRCDTFDCLGALASTQPRFPSFGCGCP